MCFFLVNWLVESFKWKIINKLWTKSSQILQSFKVIITEVSGCVISSFSQLNQKIGDWFRWVKNTSCSHNIMRVTTIKIIGVLWHWSTHFHHHLLHLKLQWWQSRLDHLKALKSNSGKSNYTHNHHLCM